MTSSIDREEVLELRFRKVKKTTARFKLGGCAATTADNDLERLCQQVGYEAEGIKAQDAAVTSKKYAVCGVRVAI